MNKNILMFIDSIGYGGAQNQFVNLALLLKKRSYNVSILVVFDEYDFYKDKLKDIEIICDKKSRSSIRRPLRLALLIKKRSPDIVISYLDSQCIIACISKWFFKHRLIVSERNTTQLLNRREKIKFWLYRFADYIVPNSYTQGRFIAGHYPKYKDKIRVITNVIDEHRFYPPAEKKRNGIPHVISVGRNTPQKNYLMMVEAVKILKDKGIEAHYDWYAGVQEQEYASRVREKINEYLLQDTISIFDPTNNIGDKYRDSDFFWLASNYEGFPNALCEAMICGLPVACSNVCDNPDIVKEGENGYMFSPSDVREMTDKLESLLTLEENKYQVISSNNVKRIKDICAEKSFEDKYVQLIEN